MFNYAYMSLAGLVGIVLIGAGYGLYVYQPATDTNSTGATSTQEEMTVSTTTAQSDVEVKAPAGADLKLIKKEPTGTADSTSESKPSITADSASKPVSESNSNTGSSSDSGEISSIANALQELSKSLEEYRDLVDTASVGEKEIDLRVVVLVRCIYKSQLYAQSSQPGSEAFVSVGSGVLVSPSGHILTAGHVVRTKNFGTDNSGRTWTIDHCEAARTVGYDTRINANPPDYRDSTGFEEVEIVHEVTETSYKESAGLDLAILKFKSGNPGGRHATLYPNLVALPDKQYSVVAIGYPGKDGTIWQSVERFDGASLDLQSFEKSGCGLNKLSEICGWRYSIGRAWLDFDEYYGYFTEYGKVSTTAKGGFSGGPAFHKGNLIGIVTHGKGRIENGIDSGSGLDFFSILNSRDISRYLSAQGITL